MNSGFNPRMRKFTLSSLLTCTVLTTACPADETGDDEVGTGTETASSESTATETESSTSDSTSDTTDTTETTTETTEGPDPICGDGTVDADLGEECDDANMVDTDECTAACTLAICGDSIVQVGVEACDDGNMDDGDGCSAMCLIESCGDGIVQPGLEECDDANLDDTDACTSMCLLAVCGDMVVQAGVEQCDDANMVDTDECTSACVLAVCGDMLVQDGVEACDDGNLDDTDMCLGVCTLAACGDGAVQAGVEECDDSNIDVGDGCSATCQYEQRLVFVTSTLQYGDMNGLAGADTICNDLAQEAGLPGTYKAWLSTGQANGTPAVRFTQSAVPYVKVDGVKVADNWADLTDGTLDSAINRTELNAAPPAGNPTCGNTSVWSNTNSNGTLFNSINSCGNYLSTASAGHWGQSALVNGGWSSACSGGTCSWQEPMYCFQQ